MHSLLSATSMLAVSAGIPEINDEVPDYIEARILYNPFAPREVQIEKLDFRSGLTLADYFEGLPAEASWMAFHNGVEVEQSQFDSVPVVKGDRLALILIPQGNTVKSILRVALVIAGVVIGSVIAGPLGAAIGAAIGNLIGTLLLSPKAPKQAEDEGQSYGIDGAKNSATEGIPFPVVYGEFRVAGNYADVYTENVGDVQYLHIRSILNDGLIEGVYDIEANEQPLTNFKNAETEIKLGTATQPVSLWFGKSIVQQSKSIKLDTSWTSHITTGPVDQVRFDLVFPSGLVDVDQKKGTHRNRTVNFEMRYRPVNELTAAPTGGWVNLTPRDPITESPYGKTAAWQTAKNFEIQARAPIGASSEFTPAVEYRAVGDVNWTSAGTILEDSTKHQMVVDQTSGVLVGGEVYPYSSRFFDTGDVNEALDYEFRGVNGAEIIAITSYPKGGTGTGRVTDSRTRQIRSSFVSGRFARGRYEVSIRRVNAESVNEYIIDQVYLTDVGEIDLDPMTLRHTAYLGLRIKLDEQLNQIPQLTARVKGCILQEYDATGTPTLLRWSANPAWIALDILIGQARGAGLSASRIDFPAFVALAEYCDANSITFNGVFDTGTNLGDALRQVLRVGQAIPIPFGTRISVAIDQPRSPVQMFSSGNITGDDFQVNYISMNDRANEFEVSYYDKTDKNKQKNIKYIDPKAVTFNEVPRKVSISLLGVDNAAQAKKELWRAVYSNRLIVRTVSFTTELEAISMLLGDIALIQHPLIDWTYQGRLDGNTIASLTQVDLDQDVIIGAGETHSILIRHDVVDLGTFVINSKVGNRILVPTAAAITQDSVKRITSLDGVNDVAVYRVEKGGIYDTLHLDDATSFAAAQSVKLWNLDAIEEREVTSVETIGFNKSRVTLAAPLSKFPTPLSIYVLGKVTQVRRPYVLNGISGEGLESRKLTFIEYNQAVYSAPELDLPTPVGRLSDMRVEQVRGLLFDYELLSEANRSIMNCRIHWASGHIRNYGGADVYMTLNGVSERFIGSTDAGNEFTVQLSPDDKVSFRVVAKNTSGNRAPVVEAPSVDGVLTVTYAALDPPTSLSYAMVSFEADAKARFWWSPPIDVTGIEGYEFQYRIDTDLVWSSVGQLTTTGTMVEVPGLAPDFYEARVRAISRTSRSTWFTTAPFEIVTPIGSLLNLRPAQPGADVTASNTAAAIAGQGALATSNSASWGSQVTGAGKPEDYATVGARSGVNLTNNAGSATLGDLDIVTPLGTAAAIAGQGALATQSVVKVSQMLSTAPSYCPDPQFADETFWQLSSGGWYFQTSNPAQTGTGGKGAALWSGAPGNTIGTTQKVVFTPLIDCPVPTGTRLMISAHHWNASSQSCFAEVQFFDKDTVFLDSMRCLSLAGTSGVFHGTGIVHASTRYIKFVIYNEGGSAFSGAAQITGIRLVDVSQYSDGALIDALRPAEVGANVTETRTAAAITGQAATATSSDFSAVTGLTKPEANADVTATAAVLATMAANKTVPATYTGVVAGGDLSALVWTPVVTKGGVSKKLDAGTTYEISSTYGGTFARDNTDGSSSKGNITISAITSNAAGGDLIVTVAGVALPKIAFKVDKVLADPPLPSGGTVKTVTWAGGEFVGINTVSYTLVVSALKTVALASGESLYGTAPLDYNVAGTGLASRTMSFKWQYSVTGANSWSDFAAAITGTTAFSADFATETDQSPGYVNVTQTKSGLGANTYDVRLVGVCSTTGRVCTPSGTATVEAKT